MDFDLVKPIQHRIAQLRQSPSHKVSGQRPIIPENANSVVSGKRSQKRARTRTRLIEAAKTLLTERPIEAVTVHEVVTAPAVAKGTFYYHFNDLEELAAAVASQMARGFDEVIGPRRLVFADPLERVACGVMGFLDKAVADHRWGRLVLNGPTPSGLRRPVRDHLMADLSAAQQAGELDFEDIGLAADLVIGIWREVTRAIVEDRLGTGSVDVACAAMLRALGLTRSQASALTARVRRKAIDPSADRDTGS